jgi:hypothetical protein
MNHATAIAPGWIGWLPFVVLPGLALAARPFLPAWAFMWLLAGAIFLGCKWQTWWQVVLRRGGAPQLSVAYLVAWPGMDASSFLTARAGVAAPRAGDWLWAIGKTALGAILFWGGARLLLPYSELLAGWVGMAGLIFLLHFGSFHLLALVWRRAGVDAQPIMRAPHRATSLAEFWGRRWNLGFRQLTHDIVFVPLSKRAGVTPAIFAAFVVSGLIHDAVISLPAGGGYGLPSAYFVLQGCGLIVERSWAGRRLGLGRGARGWLFTAVVTAGPVAWLFHAPFAGNVVLPFLREAGAL